MKWGPWYCHYVGDIFRGRRIRSNAACCVYLHNKPPTKQCWVFLSIRPPAYKTVVLYTGHNPVYKTTVLYCTIFSGTWNSCAQHTVLIDKIAVCTYNFIDIKRNFPQHHLF